MEGMTDRTKKLKELDADDLRLIDSGIALLAARHKVEEKMKQTGEEAASQPLLAPAT